MQTVEGFNAMKMGRLVTRIQYLFLGVTITLTLLVCFFAFKWGSTFNQEYVYFVTPEGTYCSKARHHAIRTEPFEVENFTIQLLKHLFEHNEFSYQANLDAALKLMDRKSRLFVQSKYNEEELFNIYKHYNGISTLSIDHFEVGMQDYPYEVAVSYTVTMNYIGLAAKKMTNISKQTINGSIYFKVHTTHRTKENPYGLLITHFNFVHHDHAKK